ncbi:MAG: hypothetical protein A2544_00585 [Candidatus Zambryskibacteria bacterium RIFOXYD2_FULL_43_10]|uniref:Antitoxin SocA-like Panacea domain-containing protein n=1 Tax=Candidatus Zambryskibacteria bacterium RIFOXYD2_FULL_43_10 TaxID=1802782 RepID=A0A1G2V8W5_9BACT|nr:MAG: hypothetical protein A2544_00585 [Candidatus Zambryskibacteria bacterium RIFOXYD2_FULL_43_10]
MREDKAKIENLVLHFGNVGMLHLGKKKLAKLLYFVDFTSYEMLNHPITGLKYEKRQYGPMPVAKIYYKYLNNLESSGKIKIGPPNEDKRPQSIISLQEPDYSVFDEEEKKIIFDLTDKFKHQLAGEVESLAKAEPPYKMVKEGEEIPYHLAFYRNSFDEVTLDEENSST